MAVSIVLGSMIFGMPTHGSLAAPFEKRPAELVTTWLTESGHRVKIRRQGDNLKLRVVNSDYLVKILSRYFELLEPEYNKQYLEGKIGNIVAEELLAIEGKSGITVSVKYAKTNLSNDLGKLINATDVKSGEALIVFGENNTEFLRKFRRWNRDETDGATIPKSSLQDILIQVMSRFPGFIYSFVPNSAIITLKTNGAVIEKSACFVDLIFFDRLSRKINWWLARNRAKFLNSERNLLIGPSRHAEEISRFAELWPSDNFSAWVRSFPDLYVRHLFRGCMANSLGLNVGAAMGVEEKASAKSMSARDPDHIWSIMMLRIAKYFQPINDSWLYLEMLYHDKN